MVQNRQLGNKAGETKPFKDDGLSALTTSGKMTFGSRIRSVETAQTQKL